jgi:[ribosomal protein S5]-alanine N-acetyltransferase
VSQIVLETRRLILRRLTLDDVEDLARIYADPDVMRFLDGPRTLQQTQEWVEGNILWYDRLEHDMLATVLKESGRLIGRCGLLKQTVDGVQEIEVAYMIDKPYWGRGLGTEAARALKEFGRRRFGYTRFISLIDPENLASQRVAEKNGMRYEKDGEHEGRSFRVYAVQVPAFAELAKE